MKFLNKLEHKTYKMYNKGMKKMKNNKSNNRKEVFKIIKFILLIFLVYLILTTVIISAVMHKKAKTNYEDKTDFKNDEVALIEKPGDAFNIRLNLIDQAKKTIDICYYKMDTSESSTIFLKKLADASDRGVKVRILLNSLTDSFKFSQKWRKEFMLDHPNISLYYYKNPLLNFYKLQDNLHDKALIIDDTYILTGGRNIGDRFFKEDNNVVFDLDILVKRKSENSSIDDYKKYYENLINSSSSKKQKAKRSYENRLIENRKKMQESVNKINWEEKDILGNISYTNAGIYFVHNELNQYVKDPLVFDYIEKVAKKSKKIKWLSPYIVFTKPIRNTLDIDNWKNDVTFITNSSKTTPNFPAFSATFHYVKTLKSYGDLYSYTGKGSVHSKAIVFDDEISAVGSLNIDPRSAYLSTETMTFIKSEKFNSTLKNYIESFEDESWDKAQDEIPILKKLILIIFSIFVLLVIPLT